MLVGEAPGEREDNIHKPFQGRAGQMLDSFLDTFELPRPSVFISNAVKCRPLDNATPDWKEIQACRSYLLSEIAAVKPKVIIALGKVAAQSLLNLRTFTLQSLRGVVHRVPDTGHRVVVTYHPAAILRNNYFMEPSVQDFEFAMNVLEGKEIKEPPKMKYRWVENPWDEIKLKKVIAIDFETTGLDVFKKGWEIKTVQICQQEGFAYMIPWNDKTAEWFRKEIAENEEIEKVGHNLRYDMKCARRVKIEFKGPIFDTLIAVHLLDENLPEKSLDAVANQYTQMKHHKQAMKKWLSENPGELLVNAPMEILLPYGCGDADATLRLRNIFYAKLREDRRRHEFNVADLWTLFQFQMDVLRGPALEMEYVGAKIDTDYLPELGKLYERRIAIDQRIFHRLVRKARGVFGEELNVNSSKQLSKVFYDQWDFPALGKPKSYGKPLLQNTAELTLTKLIQWLAEEKPFRWKTKTKAIKYIMEIRSNRKLLSTYVVGIQDDIRAGGKIHPSFKMHGTVTGRWSCTEPNLQQIPRKGEIKKLFISRYGEEGAIFKCDLSQAELRLAAWIADEEHMLKDLWSGLDIHKRTASRVFEIPFDEVTDDQRKYAKIVNFGILYGAGVHKVAEAMGCSQDDAQKFLDRFNKRYPGFQRDVRWVKKMIVEYGYVRAWSGRIRRTPVLQPYGKEFNAALREAFNSRIQGGVSDILVFGMLQVYREIKKRGLKAVFIANVHDEFVIDTLKIHVQELNEICIKTFVRDDLLNKYHHSLTRNLGVGRILPLEIETAAGPNWLEVETIHGDKEVRKA